MRGRGEEITQQPLEILVEEGKYRIGRKEYQRTATDKELEVFTTGVLDIFRKLEVEVNTKKSITLSPDICHDQLVKLARWGTVAYNRFFADQHARELFKYMIDRYDRTSMFVSTSTPFPWEILYEGEDYIEGDPEKFWGLNYTIARDLDPESNTIPPYPETQHTSDMLFCLHHELLYSHKHERSAIEKLVIRSTQQGQFNVLGPTCGFNHVDPYRSAGEVLIRYLHTSNHNMVHFACHCKQNEKGDVLSFSVLKGENTDDGVEIIKLETHQFDLVGKKLGSRPFVFLNACQSASEPDELGKTFNLPQVFIKYGAGAVIATICPVPDIFASAFAKVFYEYFLSKDKNIGVALRATRLHFIEKYHNPLGLAYGLYSPANYHVIRPRARGGIYQ